ncbi:hypothetical protein [Puia dinghuensis]|uniref:hypothetical protein n=1 Tax=Puia dinghuensis TaxID=1792502 RepID=UPI00166CB284|nr:hypothetical protein [Puia dinghuensis]
MSESTTPPPVSSPGLLNEWLYDIIEPWLKGRVLEVGSTPHSISAIFAQKGQPIHLSSSDKYTRDQLRTKYQGIEPIRDVKALDFHRADFEQAYPVEVARFFDTVLVLNQSCNSIIVRNARHLLRDRGRLVALAPVYTTIYSGLEIDLEDLKKYNHQSIKRLMTDEMEILATHYFNQSSPSFIVIARKLEPQKNLHASTSR